ncbi:unnamed protein product [Soboliphyme baturini]|uniref:Frizzled-4 n=1 Tax=Soboliphyme baturini TaxID=241478 RepID=A0A183ITQ4_9BILA|nr:unnamed protein product [Soboliphyme baturini]
MSLRLWHVSLWLCYCGVSQLIVVSVGASGRSFAAHMSPYESPCERITVPLCRDTPYNLTRMPNMLGDLSQLIVAKSMRDYEPLINQNCSVHLKFFLCSVFTPMCTEAVDEPITSCRSVCEEVMHSCLPLLTNFGIPWPAILNCSQFPLKGNGALCMDPTTAYNSAKKAADNGDRHIKAFKRFFVSVAHSVTLELKVQTDVSSSTSCGTEFVKLEREGSSGTQCALRCDQQWMFTKNQKEFAEKWMTVWAAVCFVVTVITVITFLIDMTRFTYPKRPIIFISFSYCLYSLAYLVRASLGSESIACTQLSGHSVLISRSLDNPRCVIIFLVLYYFSTASSVWWLILTMTWFLSASRKWGQEAIARLNSFFHIIAWVIPAGLTIAVLVTHEVDASELTGLCFVSQRDSSATYGFFIAPVTIFSLIGIGFMVAGIMAMSRISKEMRCRVREVDLFKLKKLTTQVCIFSVLYVLPTLVVIICEIYEKLTIEEWMKRHRNCVLLSAQLEDAGPTTPAAPPRDAATGKHELLRSCRQPGGGESAARAPVMEVYVLKIFTSLVIGITSSMWIWSQKTVVTWRRFICCCLLTMPPAKTSVQYMPVVSDKAKHPSASSTSQLARAVGGATSGPARAANGGGFFNYTSVDKLAKL